MGPSNNTGHIFKVDLSIDHVIDFPNINSISVFIQFTKLKLCLFENLIQYEQLR